MGEEEQELSLEQPTEQERTWALLIKQAAANDDTINDAWLSDFEYLQHAIVAKDRVDKALVRIRRLQTFKQRYGIKLDGSVDEASRDLQTFTSQHPGVFVSLAKNTLDDSHVFCVDDAPLQAKRIKKSPEESCAIIVRALFYAYQASQPTIRSMRAGLYSLSRLRGAGWRNYSHELEEKMKDLYDNAYPFRLQQLGGLEASWLGSILFQIVELFMTKKTRRRIFMTSQGEAYLRRQPKQYPKYVLPEFWGGALDSSGKNVVAVILAKLEERYRNAKAFRLSPDDDNTSSNNSD